MQRQNDIHKELKSLAPDFSWPEKSPVYDIPEGYFEKLPGQILRKIRSSELTGIKRRPHSLFSSWRKWAAAAVITVLIISGIMVGQRLYEGVVINQKLSSLSDGAIESYLNTQAELSDITPMVKVSDLSEKDLKSLLKEVSEVSMQP